MLSPSNSTSSSTAAGTAGAHNGSTNAASGGATPSSDVIIEFFSGDEGKKNWCLYYEPPSLPKNPTEDTDDINDAKKRPAGAAQKSDDNDGRFCDAADDLCNGNAADYTTNAADYTTNAADDANDPRANNARSPPASNPRTNNPTANSAKRDLLVFFPGDISDFHSPQSRFPPEYSLEGIMSVLVGRFPDKAILLIRSKMQREVRLSFGACICFFSFGRFGE
jgi:hypothetical protein